MSDIIEIKVLSPEEENSRDAYLFDYHSDHSKRKGDYHFREAAAISGDGDYIPGQDDGEMRRGVYPNQE
jgi:hypothetical protein